MELNLWQKSDFLIKIACVQLLFDYFCQEFADSLAPGGTLPPFISATALQWLFNQLILGLANQLTEGDSGP